MANTLEMPGRYSDEEEQVQADLQLRTEFARSVADREKYQALQTLREMGLLRPMADTDLYHGRVAEADSGGTQWIVSPVYEDNGGNFHKRSALYTAPSDVDAFDFANTRGNQIEPYKEGNRSREYKNYVFKIESPDTDAMIIDLDSAELGGKFREQIQVEEGGRQYLKAAEALALPITEGSPVDFRHRGSVAPVMQAFRAGGYNEKKRLIPDGDIEGLAKKAGVERGLVVQLASAYNAQRLFIGDMAGAVGMLLANDKDFAQPKGRDKYVGHTFNLEYIQRTLESAHIVGSSRFVRSATIDRWVPIVALFDLNAVQESETIKEERKSMNQQLGGIAAGMAGALERSSRPSGVVRALQDVYVKPEVLVAEAAKVSEGYHTILSMPAGNEEGYKLSEHLETVLRNFDEEYADRVPVELLGPMRLLLLVHDMAKPVARAQGREDIEDELNAKYAADFMQRAGVADDLNRLVVSMLGKGEDLTHTMMLDKDMGVRAQARESLANHAREALHNFRRGEVTDAQVAGFMEMCTMLLVCDGGAYTSMAVTRKAGTPIRSRNYPSFNERGRGFAQPVDPGKRGLRLRSDADEPAAALDLTPRQEGIS